MYIRCPEGAFHLSYCLNAHPGETWSENFEAIRTYARGVRDRLGWEEPFGLGLRLSSRAADELASAEKLSKLKSYLEHEKLYAFTVNGFPYGPFHGDVVKANVYSPDWSTDERVDYTIKLVNILAALLPEGLDGSISTVPGTYREWSTSPDHLQAMLLRLGRAAWHCAEAFRQTGRHVRIALEPEPDCFWDSTDQAVELFHETIPDQMAPLLAADRKVSRVKAARVLRDHLGICFDTCHQAVLFEDVVQTLSRLRDQDVPVAKVHVSAALTCAVGPAALDQLETFVDPVYLHQTCIHTDDGSAHRFPDLPEALEAARALRQGGELRTHFHIPLSVAGHGDLGSTRTALTPAFFELLRSGAIPHCEIETYTYSILPEEMQQADISDSIAAEIRWFMGALDQGRPQARGEAAP